MQTETVEAYMKRGGKIQICAEGESAFTMKTFRESFTMRKGVVAYWKRRNAERKWWEHRLKNAENHA